MQNFYKDDSGLVYEKHYTSGEKEAANQLVESAERVHKLSTRERERIYDEKERKHHGSEGKTDWAEKAKLELPYEVETDRQVLRAYAFYQESVPESEIERSRYRHVRPEILCYVWWSCCLAVSLLRVCCRFKYFATSWIKPWRFSRSLRKILACHKGK